jgi:hypothetical protein
VSRKLTVHGKHERLVHYAAHHTVEIGLKACLDPFKVLFGKLSVSKRVKASKIAFSTSLRLVDGLAVTPISNLPASSSAWL